MRRRPSSAARRTPPPAFVPRPRSLAAHTRARARASAPGGERDGHATEDAGEGVHSQAAPRPAPAGPGLSAPREGVGRGGGRRTLPSPGRAGRGPRSRDRRARDCPGRRARELLPGGGLLAPSFWDPPPSSPPPSPPLPSRGTLGDEEFSVCSHPAREVKLEKEDEPGRGSTRPAPLNLDARDPSRPRAPIRAHNPSQMLPERRSKSRHSPAAACWTEGPGPRGHRSWAPAAPLLQRVGLEATGYGASR